MGVGAQAPKGLPLVVDIVTEYFCVFRFSPVVFTHGLFQNGFGSEIWLDRLSVYAGPAIRLIYPFWSQTCEASFKQFGPRRFGLRNSNLLCAYGPTDPKWVLSETFSCTVKQQYRTGPSEKTLIKETGPNKQTWSGLS